MAYPYQTGYNQVMPPVYGGYGQQPLQPQGPMCRMVSSREEASSTPVDFSGSLMVFADIQTTASTPSAGTLRRALHASGSIFQRRLRSPRRTAHRPR